MRITIDYDTCPPSSYGKDFMNDLVKKVEALEHNADKMIFTKQSFDKDNMLIDEKTFTLNELNVRVQAIEINLDYAGDEFYLFLDTEIERMIGGNGTMKQFTDSINIEVVTKEVAEENDRDFLGGEYNDLVESGYEVGDNNSYYKQIGDTNFYYREM